MSDAALDYRRRIPRITRFSTTASPSLVRWTLRTLTVILFGAATLFAAVTLPVEYNASARARQLLEDNGVVTQAEVGSVRNMLNAAALTYVAVSLYVLVTGIVGMLLATLFGWTSKAAIWRLSPQALCSGCLGRGILVKRKTIARSSCRL